MRLTELKVMMLRRPEDSTDSVAGILEPVLDQMVGVIGGSPWHRISRVGRNLFAIGVSVPRETARTDWIRTGISGAGRHHAPDLRHLGSASRLLRSGSSGTLNRDGAWSGYSPDRPDGGRARRGLAIYAYGFCRRGLTVAHPRSRHSRSDRPPRVTWMPPDLPGRPTTRSPHWTQ